MKTSDFLLRLIEREIDFVLVGGLAVQLHGYMRMTYDVDLTLAMDGDNLTRFVALAEEVNLAPVAPVPLTSLHNPELLAQWRRDKGMLAFSLREAVPAGIVVDVLIAPEVSHADLRRRASNAHIGTMQFKIASIEHLIAMKRHAGRPKDLIDIAALERIERGDDPNA